MCYRQDIVHRMKCRQEELYELSCGAVWRQLNLTCLFLVPSYYVLTPLFHCNACRMPCYYQIKSSWRAI